MSGSHTTATAFRVTMGACLLAALLTSGCEDGVRKAPGPPSSIVGRTAMVERVLIPDVLVLPGTLVSEERIEVSSRVVGFIQELDVREGQAITRGDLLVQIDPTEIEEAIKRAEATLEATRDELADAEHDVTKLGALAAGGWSSEEALRKARVRRDIARAAVTKAKAALIAALAQRDYATIVSPIDGIVVSRHRSRGDMTTTGAPILTLESRRDLSFHTFMAEANLPGTRLGAPVTLRFDALARRTFTGRLQRLVPSGDPLTRRYEVVVALDPDPDLVAGMFGRAELPRGDTLATMVPHSSVVRYGGLDGVFVVAEDGVARFRWLRFARERNGLVEVTAGLKGGERILTAGADTARDGAVVSLAGWER